MQDIMNPDKFVKAMNNQTQMGLICSLRKHELFEYVQRKVAAYYRTSLERNEPTTPRISTAVVGFNKSKKVFVLSNTLQFSENGLLLADPPCILTDEVKYLIPSIPLPLCQAEEPLKDLLALMEGMFMHNFMSAVGILAGGLMSLHYLRIVEAFGSCPVIFAFSKDVDTGKTTSLKVLCNLFGVADSFHSSITEAVLKRILSQSTLPCVVDDVDSVRGIEKLAVRYFNGGAQTDSNGTYSPVTTFLCSANFVLGENARLATRCLLVPFTLPSITPTTTDQYKYFESYVQVAIEASSGIGQLLAVGSKFVREQDIVKDIYKKEVENVLRGKHPRLQSGYAALLYMMHEILLLGGRHKTVEEMGCYFKDLMVPIIDDLVTLQEDKSHLYTFLCDVGKLIQVTSHEEVKTFINASTLHGDRLRGRLWCLAWSYW
ncbi:uncharacterized protein [Ptychodera flava]|uniref:uncharacterized protein n=1 Tax=Ptychodera flava TaxID=63121 RepID=UPI00396A53E2